MFFNAFLKKDICNSIFKLNIYKTALKVSFIDYVRPEKKFSGITSLKNQIKKDISKAKKILN